MLSSMRETAEFGFYLMTFIGIWALIIAKLNNKWAYLIGAIFGVAFIGQGLLEIIQKINWTFF